MATASAGGADKAFSGLTARAGGFVLVAALGIAAGFYLLLPADFRDRRAVDHTDYYRPVAENLLDGRGLLDRCGAPAVRFPPGHPAFLAAAFALGRAMGRPGDAVVLAALFFLHALSSLWVAWLGSRLWGRRAGVACGLIWSAYPLALWAVPLAGSEIPYTLLLLTVTAMYWLGAGPGGPRRGAVVLAGLASGAAMLCRPIGLGLPVVLAGLILLRRGPWPLRRRAVLAAWLIAGAALVVAPWQAWMTAATGRWYPLSSGGMQSLLDGVTFARLFEPQPGAAIPPDVRALMDGLWADYAAGRIDGPGALLARLAAEARSHPRSVARLAGVKALRVWYGTASGRWEGPIQAIQWPLLAIGLAGWWTAYRRGGARREAALLLGALLLYHGLMAWVALSIVRYMVPVMWALVVMVPAPFVRDRRCGNGPGRAAPAQT